MDVTVYLLLLLPLVSIQLDTVFAQSGCLPLACPKEICFGKYTIAELPDGCKEIFCDMSDGSSSSFCPAPKCPNTCSDKGNQVGVIKNGCCECACKSTQTTCPTNCQFGTKLITVGGSKKCVCVKNPSCPANCEFGERMVTVNGRTKCVCKDLPCPPFVCSKNCPPPKRKTVKFGKCQACVCDVKICLDEGRCDSCANGVTYGKVNGCHKCKCCPPRACPKTCTQGTENVLEEGCMKCVCKCGPPICNVCPPPPNCRLPCKLQPDGPNGCEICKCPKTCQKSCNRFKFVNGKQLCECCPSRCQRPCQLIPGGYDGCGICNCPKTCQKSCNRFKFVNGKQLCECCPLPSRCQRPCQLIPGGYDRCGICKCPKTCQKNCNKFKYVNGKKLCECCPQPPRCQRPCEFVPGGNEGCGICKCPKVCPRPRHCPRHCRNIRDDDGCMVCSCQKKGHPKPKKHKKGKKKKGGHGGPKRGGHKKHGHHHG